MSGATVVTGLGVVSPNGLGLDDYWSATLSGVNGINRVTRFDPSSYPSQLAGEVHGFDATDHLPGPLIAQTDHMTRLALVATDWALADADVDPTALDEFGMGVVTANSAGGFEFGQRELEKLWSKGPEYVSAYQSFAWFYAVNTGQISIRHGMRGPSGVLANEQAGGLDAVAQARRLIRKGADLMITGGIDAALCPWGWVAQMAGGDCSTVDDPDRAYLPFAADASGHVPGEGGAILVLEDAGAAADRGHAGSYGGIVGYGSTFDRRPGPAPRSRLAAALRLAMDDAGVDAEDVDVVFADAAGTLDADRVEAEAITAVFRRRPRPVPVTAPKTMTGRLSSGGGPVDLAAAFLSIRDNVIPPTINVGRMAPGCALDLVRQPRAVPVRVAVVLARGVGGFNSAMVVRSPGPALSN